MFDLRASDRIILNVESALHTWEHHTDEVNQIAVSASGNYLASCDDDGFLSVILTKNLSVHTYQKAHENVGEQCFCIRTLSPPPTRLGDPTSRMMCTYTHTSTLTHTSTRLHPHKDDVYWCIRTCTHTPTHSLSHTAC
jgi:WD40 repeat protein